MTAEAKTIFDRLVNVTMKETGYIGQTGHWWWDGERLRFEEIDQEMSARAPEPDAPATRREGDGT